MINSSKQPILLIPHVAEYFVISYFGKYFEKGLLLINILVSIVILPIPSTIT